MACWSQWGAPWGLLQVATLTVKVIVNPNAPERWLKTGGCSSARRWARKKTGAIVDLELALSPSRRERRVMQRHSYRGELTMSGHLSTWPLWETLESNSELGTHGPWWLLGISRTVAGVPVIRGAKT
jgi:hypothetical protein